MLFKETGTYLRNSGIKLASICGSAFGLVVFVLMFSTTTTSAQALIQGSEAVSILKEEISRLEETNCAKQVSGISPAVRQQMNALRCDFYEAVYSGMKSIYNPASVETGKRIDVAHANMLSNNPAAEEALDNLKSEVQSLLTK